MRVSTRVRRTLATVAAAALVLTGTLSATSAANAAPPPVSRMAALGDSITQAVNSCSSWSGCAQYSWATGTSTSVPSHLRQLQGLGAAVVGYNDSVSGALSSALNTQAQKAVTQQVQYVTIEIGANDACTRTVATMTPVPTFKTNVENALKTLAASPTGAPQVFVASIPSLQQLWSINYTSSSARLTWGLLRICQSMLANPSSMQAADVQRRATVQAQVNAYNVALSELCAPGNAYNCRYDGGAVANTAFIKADISTRDYFHPSLAGQVKLASITWPKTQWVS
jgi:lysophospholipase L1-like esterase